MDDPRLNSSVGDAERRHEDAEHEAADERRNPRIGRVIALAHLPGPRTASHAFKIERSAALAGSFVARFAIDPILQPVGGASRMLAPLVALLRL